MRWHGKGLRAYVTGDKFSFWEGSMGRWVKCTLTSGEKFGEAKLVRHLNLDHYVEMEQNRSGTVLKSALGGGELSVMETPDQLLGIEE